MVKIQHSIKEKSRNKKIKVNNNVIKDKVRKSYKKLKIS